MNVRNKTVKFTVNGEVIKFKLASPIISKDEEKVSAPKLGKSLYHYRIIDIKYMTLLLKCDGKTLLNGGLVPAYKSQLYIYNQGLGVMQGYTPPQAYLLGRRSVYTSMGQKYIDNDCFGNLGIINYKLDDKKYSHLTQKAIKWINRCKTPEAKKWNVDTYPLSKIELYPNMCNTYDYPFHDLKLKINT